MLRAFTLLIVPLLSVAAVAAQDAEELGAVEHFEKHIRPVLVRHCYECHSAQAAEAGKLKGGLRVDTREGLRRGGDSGPAVVPGRPEEGTLLGALRHETFEMPPDLKLDEQVVRNFERWIAGGAADPRTEPMPTARSPAPAIDFEEARQFWSLKPLRRSPPPDVQNPDWPKSSIDTFILAKLEEHGLKPVDDADPRALLRRLYFDLIGLPPRPEDVDDFLAAVERDRAQAIRDVVDQLLASPHFGERWGRHWLDVVRFAESNGRDINTVWHHAWRYRRWVIESFNADKPFDQMIREQIAGDLLPADSWQQRDEQIIATAVLAMTPKLIQESDKTLFRMNLIDDQIDMVTRAFLGLSVSCARCHDHKFDPIPTRDYYALAGIFLSTEPLYGYGRLGAQNSPDTELVPVGPEAERLGPSGHAYRQQVSDKSMGFQKARSDRYRVVRQVSSLKTQLDDPHVDRARLEAEIAALEKEIEAWDERIEQLEEELTQLKRHPPALPGWTMAARDFNEPADCRVYIRGEVTNPAETVPRGLLQVISLPEISQIEANQSGRLQLAEWLAHPENPLTPRVAVNRIWAHLFGTGIVATVDDFGVSGAAPSHPELLDDLALTFVEEGWSVKKVIRRIVLSRTYQLSADMAPASFAADPENRLLWRFPPRRLEVEAFRDAVLAVSGVLNASPPPQPFLARWNPYEHDKITIVRPFITPEQIQWDHRTVYLPVLRESLPELFNLFDFADPNTVVGQRNVSTLPAQALFLMNSDWILEQSRLAAQRLLSEPPLSDGERIDLLYRRAYGRPATDSERRRALEYLHARDRARVATEENDASPSAETAQRQQWANLCQLVFCSAEFWYVR